HAKANVESESAIGFPDYYASKRVEVYRQGEMIRTHQIQTSFPWTDMNLVPMDPALLWDPLNLEQHTRDPVSREILSQPSGILDGATTVRPEDVRDGLSSTFLVVEDAGMPDMWFKDYDTRKLVRVYADTSDEGLLAVSLSLDWLPIWSTWN